MKFAPMNQKTIVVQQIFTKHFATRPPLLIGISIFVVETWSMQGHVNLIVILLVHGRFPEQHSMFQLLPNKSYHSMQTFAKQILVSILFTLNYFSHFAEPQEAHRNIYPSHVLLQLVFGTTCGAPWFFPKPRQSLMVCAQVSPPRGKMPSRGLADQKDQRRLSARSLEKQWRWG